MDGLPVRVSIGACFPVSIKVWARWDPHEETAVVVRWEAEAIGADGSGLLEHLNDEDRDRLDEAVLAKVQTAGE